MARELPSFGPAVTGPDGWGRTWRSLVGSAGQPWRAPLRQWATLWCKGQAKEPEGPPVLPQIGRAWGFLGKFHKDLPSAPFLTNPGHTRSRAHPCTITYVYLSIILSFEGVHGIPCLSYKHSTCRDSPPRLQILDFTFCFKGDHPTDSVLSQLAAHRFIFIIFFC